MPPRRFSVAAGQAIKDAITNGEAVAEIRARAELYGIHPDTLGRWLKPWRPPSVIEIEYCRVPGCGLKIKTHAKCAMCGQLLGYGEHLERPGKLCGACERMERRGR